MGGVGVWLISPVTSQHAGRVLRSHKTGGRDGPEMSQRGEKEEKTFITQACEDKHDKNLKFGNNPNIKYTLNIFKSS